MAIDVQLTTDAREALTAAGEFLASDPVRHNLIASLLQGRAATPGEGRYVLASEGADVVGLVFQSPLSFFATITPMRQEVSEACVELLAGEAVGLPGVNGEAASAAHFAGQWTERTKSAARPDQGLRIYEAGRVTEPADVHGRLRVAEAADRSAVIDFVRGFQEDTGEPRPDDEQIDRRIAAGQFFLWEDPKPVSVAALTAPLLGVCRVQAVYTPPAARNQGYAAACVARVTAQAQAAGNHCILYTDLGNPTSNSVYRRIGYRAVSEGLRYTFSSPIASTAKTTPAT